MPYHYKVTLARKNQKKDKSLLPDILDRFAAAFRSSLHRAALRDLFIDRDASLTDAVPEVRLRHTCRQETLFDGLRNRIDEPLSSTSLRGRGSSLPFLEALLCNRPCLCRDICRLPGPLFQEPAGCLRAAPDRSTEADSEGLP